MPDALDVLEYQQALQASLGDWLFLNIQLGYQYQETR